MSISIFPRLALYTSLVIATLTSCGDSNQDKAVQQAKQVQEAVAATVPGAEPVSASGYMMAVKKDGKEWEATSMMPPALSGRIIGYKGSNYLGLPYSRKMTVGRKTKLGEDDAVDIFFDSELWSTESGEIEITAVSDKWSEGKFYFTMKNKDSGKKIEFTDGFFRIPVEQ